VVIERFCEAMWLEAGLAEASVASYRRDLQLAERLCAKPLSDFSAVDVQAVLAQLQEAREAEQRAAEPPVVEPSVEEVPIVTDFDDNIDPVLVDIFTDEAQELLQTTSQLLEDDFSKKEVVEELQRTMHTLKGGARLVGFTAIGDTAHLMESVIDKVPELAEGKVRQAKTLLHFGLDAHYDMLDSVLRHEMPQPALEVNESLKTFADSGVYRPPSQKAGDNAEPAPDSSEQPQEQPQEQPHKIQDYHRMFRLILLVELYQKALPDQ